MKEIRFTDLDRAVTYFKRLRGLEGKKSLPEGYALLFPKCTSIHMMGMRIPLDIAYLDQAGRILGIETLKPWTFSHAPKGTVQILETSAGSLRGINAETGDVVLLDDADSNQRSLR